MTKSRSKFALPIATFALRIYVALECMQPMLSVFALFSFRFFLHFAQFTAITAYSRFFKQIFLKLLVKVLIFKLFCANLLKMT